VLLRSTGREQDVRWRGGPSIVLRLAIGVSSIGQPLIATRLAAMVRARRRFAPPDGA
jgi:hypothetical protein